MSCIRDPPPRRTPADWRAVQNRERERAVDERRTSCTPRQLSSQGIGPDLEFHDLALGALAAFYVPDEMRVWGAENTLVPLGATYSEAKGCCALRLSSVQLIAELTGV